MSSGQGGAATARERPPSEIESMSRPEDLPGIEPMPDTPQQRAKDEVAGPADRDVARRAYELYLARGGTHGFDMEDWIQAESELRAAPPTDSTR